MTEDTASQHVPSSVESSPKSVEALAEELSQPSSTKVVDSHSTIETCIGNSTIFVEAEFRSAAEACESLTDYCDPRNNKSAFRLGLPSQGTMEKSSQDTVEVNFKSGTHTIFTTAPDGQLTSILSIRPKKKVIPLDGKENPVLENGREKQGRRSFWGRKQQSPVKKKTVSPSAEKLSKKTQKKGQAASSPLAPSNRVPSSDELVVAPSLSMRSSSTSRKLAGKKLPSNIRSVAPGRKVAKRQNSVKSSPRKKVDAKPVEKKKTRSPSRSVGFSRRPSEEMPEESEKATYAGPVKYVQEYESTINDGESSVHVIQLHRVEV